MIKMKNFGFILIMLLAMASCQTNSTSYSVSGNIEGLDSGTIYLVKAVNGEAVVEDSSAVNAGNFSFEGEAPIPEMFYLRLNESDYFTQFFLENGDINVAAKKDSLSMAKVSGSPANDLLNEYLAELSSVNDQLLALQQEYTQAAASGDNSEVERIQIEYQVASEDMVKFVKNFVTENNSSVVAPFLTLSVLVDQLDYNELEPLVANFSPELDVTLYMQELKSVIEEQAATAIGAIAPDFTQNDPDGNPITLSSLRGKYVLIDFWAAWCQPCRQENPNVVANYNKFKDKGFDVIGVSLDQDKDSWLAAIKEDNLTWNHVSDLQYWNNAVARQYGVNSIPHSILLDKEGRIIAKNLRGDALGGKLAELMP